MIAPERIGEMEATATFKWYRSRHTGRYFIFGTAWVEKVNSYLWRAGFSSGKRKGKVREGFTSMSKARGWIESQLVRRWAATGTT